MDTINGCGLVVEAIASWIRLDLFLLICFFTYFWLCWFFVAARAFSGCSEWGLLSCCSVEASRCGGLSHYRARALGLRAQ